jgi:hypothetical protein
MAETPANNATLEALASSAWHQVQSQSFNSLDAGGTYAAQTTSFPLFLCC